MSAIETAEVLTLAEAAAYLRVSENALEKLAEQRKIPSQRIEEEWRFLKSALKAWLTFGQEFRHFYPPDDMLHPEWIDALDRLSLMLNKLSAMGESLPKSGSKQSILKHAGVFGGGDDLEEQLKELRAIRDETK